MDSIEQYRFSLLYTNTASNDKYLEIKNNIEKLCQHAKKMASIYNIKDAVFVHKIKKDLFCTIKIDNNNVYFGIYLFEKNKLFSFVPDDILKNVPPQTFDNFKQRIENISNQMSKGIYHNMGKLTLAWEQKQKEFKHNFSNLEFGEER